MPRTVLRKKLTQREKDERATKQVLDRLNAMILGMAGVEYRILRLEAFASEINPVTWGEMQKITEKTN